MSTTQAFCDSAERKKTKRWRFTSIILFVILLISVLDPVGELFDRALGRTFVARVRIDGMITPDDHDKVMDVLSRIGSDHSVKALVVRINSPGGTFVASHELYSELRKISKNKPVVAVLEDVAASGGYMAAIAVDHIIANPGTVTGSIGVIVQHFGVTDLAEKLGISISSIKSSELKGFMSPFERLSDKGEAAIKNVVDELYSYFVSMVAQRRNMTVENVEALADGRVYTGVKALKLGLIDELGSEDQAVLWLATQNISSALKDFNIDRSVHYRFLKSLLSALNASSNSGFIGLFARGV